MKVLMINSFNYLRGGGNGASLICPICWKRTGMK